MSVSETGVVLPLWLGIVVAVVATGALITAAVTLPLWLRAKKRLTRRDNTSVQAEDQRIDAELRLAEIADRLRLMTEIHDAAAATITSVISQAEGARVAADIDPGVASRVAGSIADQARSALTDLRRVANVGRQGADVPDSMPSLGSIQELFHGINESGLIVKFDESGSSFDVSASAEIAVYRIVQEALNNARQHAGAGTTVKVSMNWSGNGLQLRVEDDGTRVKNSQREHWSSSPGYSVADDQKALTEMLSGRGMKDMKARAEAFGGVFSAHRVPGVGFTVSAAFPTLRFYNAVTPVSSGPRVDPPVQRDAG